MNVQVLRKVLSTSRSARDAFSLAGRRTAGVKWRVALTALPVPPAALVVARGNTWPPAPSPPPALATLTSAPERPAVYTSASFIVKLANGLSADEQKAVIARNGGTETSSVAALRLHTIATSGDTLDATVESYQPDPQVASVEREKIRAAGATPSDPAYPDQWALPKIGWDSVYGTVSPAGSATIAVLDTGVDSSQPDLAGRLVPGYSAFTGSDPNSDPNGHGTWLGSIAAASTDNGQGIAGVAYSGASIMPVQVLDSTGAGQDGDIISGVVWAADHNANVILMGFSNPGFSQNLQDAIEYAWSKGAVLVAATGNDGSAAATSPAGDARVMGVSATDSSDSLWSGSNYGANTFIAAPGVDITADAVSSGTTSISGTSASSAFVAGAAALLQANDPSATNGAIVGRLARNADPAGTQEGTGNGRVNLALAIADTSTIEVIPTGAPPAGEGGPYVAGAKPTSSTSVSCSPSSVLAGVATTCTATVTGGAGHTPTGTVAFTSSGSGTFSGSPCTLTTVNSTTATCLATYTPTNAASTTHTITGTYSGEGGSSGYAGSSGTFNVTVSKRSSSTSVSCLSGTVLAGVGSTCTATVSDASGAGASTPAGTATFSPTGNGSFSGTPCTLPGSGSPSTCSLTSTPDAAANGTHNITASYGGSAIHNSSGNTASPFALNATRGTSTTVACSPSTVLAGVATICTATVTDTHPAGTASAPSGTVTFSTSSTGTFSGSPCTLTSATSSSSTCSVSYTPTNAASATHTITGSYGGSSTHLASSGTASVTVNKRDSSTTVSCASPATGGQPTTCTATVSDTSGTGASAPTGTVIFASSGAGVFGTTSCSLAGVTSSSSNCSVTYTPNTASAGTTQNITASYAGSTIHNGSDNTASPLVLNVTRSTSTSISCSPAQVTQGASTSCTATVTDTHPAGIASAPTGTVTFSNPAGGSFTPPSCTLSSPAANSGSCSVTYNATVGGSQTIKGTYGMTATYSDSSGTFVLDVLATTGNFQAALEGQSFGSSAWSATAVSGWAELQSIPMRVRLSGGPTSGPQTIDVTFDHAKTNGATVTAGLEDLFTFTTSSGVTFGTAPFLKINGTNDVWTYEFTVNITSSTGTVNFFTRMRAGAHNFGRNSLALGCSPSLGNVQVSKPLVAAGSPHLKETKNATATASPNGTVNYTITYQNLSSTFAATGVQITDTLPADVVYNAGSCSGGCTFIDNQTPGGGTLVWNIANVAPSASGAFTFGGTLLSSASGTETNSVTILSAQDDADLSNNTATASTTVVNSDTTPPTVTIDSLTGSGGTDSSSPFAVLTNGGATITWHATENGSFTMRLAGP